MNTEVIVTCAVTGTGDTVGKHPGVPVMTRQIWDAAVEAAKAGAAVAHVHVRDPETGRPSHDPALFREVIERIRESETDVLINITAGGGGDFVPGEEDPSVGGEGTDMQTPKERHAPVAELLPELCTLDCGSYNFADSVYVGPASWTREHARLIQGSGVKPELECFELGHVRLAKQLVEEGLVDEPPLFQLCLGVPWAAEANTETMLAMRNMLPEGANWAAFGIGRMQMPMVAQAVLLGGNVRVGLEDNLFLEKGVHATNAELVEKAIGIVEGFGARTLMPADAREKLGVKARV